MRVQEELKIRKENLEKETAKAWEKSIREIKLKEKSYIEADLKEEEGKTDKTIVANIMKVREKMNMITSILEEEEIKNEIKKALVEERSSALSEYLGKVERNSKEKEKIKEKEKEEKEKESKVSVDEKVKKLEEIVVELKQQNRFINNKQYNNNNNSRYNGRKYGNNYNRNSNYMRRQNDPRDVRYKGKYYNNDNGMNNNNRYMNMNRYNNNHNGYDNRNNVRYAPRYFNNNRYMYNNRYSNGYNNTYNNNNMHNNNKYNRYVNNGGRPSYRDIAMRNNIT